MISDIHGTRMVQSSARGRMRNVRAGTKAAVPGKIKAKPKSLRKKAKIKKAVSKGWNVQLSPSKQLREDELRRLAMPKKIRPPKAWAEKKPAGWVSYFRDPRRLIVRAKLLDACRNTCQECGKAPIVNSTKFRESTLTMHHIVPRSEDPEGKLWFEPSNIRILCVDCHAKIHGRDPNSYHR